MIGRIVHDGTQHRAAGRHDLFMFSLVKAHGAIMDALAR